MAEVLFESDTSHEEGYVTEAREKMLALKARGVASEGAERPAGPRFFASRVRPESSGPGYGSFSRSFQQEQLSRAARTGRRKTSGRRSLAQNVPPLGKLQRGFIEAVQRMIELLELPPGWNSYNAKPIRKENVTFAIDLLGRLMRENTPLPNVIPMVRGGVQFEWHTNGIDLEISIYSPHEVRFAAEDLRQGGEPVEEVGPKLTTVGDWIDRLSNQAKGGRQDSR